MSGEDKKSSTGSPKKSSDIKCYSKLKFSCLGCAKCCGLWDVPITQSEKECIERLKIPGIDFDSLSPFIPYKKSALFLIRKKSGCCVFLDRQNRCLIHKHYGEKYKPLACRLYPFDIFNWKDGIVSVSLKFDCPAVARFEGKKILEYREEILPLAKELEKRSKLSSVVYSDNVKPCMENMRSLNSAFSGFLLSDDFSPQIKIFAAARLLEFYDKKENQIDLYEGRKSYPDEVYKLVEKSVDELEYAVENADDLNLYQRINLRYLISGYARIDEEVRTRLLPFGRISRCISIVRFSLGAGSLKDLGETYPDTSGYDPLQVVKNMQIEKGAFEPFWHFFASKMSSMHFCSSPILKLSFKEGLRHLLLTFPVVTILSSLFAKVRKREFISKKEVTEALIIIDHTFSRSPFFTLRQVKKIERKLCAESAMPALMAVTKLEKYVPD